MVLKDDGGAREERATGVSQGPESDKSKLKES